MADEQNRIVPTFKTISVKNTGKSIEAGRPIFDDMEVVEVRFAANRLQISVFPAHAVWSHVRKADGTQEAQTYAQRWPEQYRLFKAGQQQVLSGTPIDELPFLTVAKRSELKALSIYTAEALAALDGPELKNLGQGGRELKNQAQAYIDNASGSAAVVRMAQEIEDLKQVIAGMQADKGAPSATSAASPFDGMSEDDLKAFIKDKTGAGVRGQPSRETLVRMASEIEHEAA